MASRVDKSLKLKTKAHYKNKFHVKTNKSRKMQKKLRGPLPPNRPPPSSYIFPTETPQAQAIRPDLSNVAQAVKKSPLPSPK
ncbi:hypothetical protein G6F56_011671 [Rhizopus delemar]|nr:hypothetical protein G6F56_011671 [Rhizopus delemar]